MQFYLAKVPAGQTAATWDGAGNVWFKIFQEEAIVTSSSISWASMNKAQYPVTLPKALPAGEYLLRAEHIALHSAGSAGGAQVSPCEPPHPMCFHRTVRVVVLVTDTSNNTSSTSRAPRSTSQTAALVAPARW